MKKGKKAFLLSSILLILIVPISCQVSNDAKVIKEYQNKLNELGAITREYTASLNDINDILQLLKRKMELRQNDEEFAITCKQLFHKKSIYLGRITKWQEELNKIKLFVETNGIILKRSKIDTDSTIYTISLALIRIKDFKKLLNNIPPK